MGDLAVAHGFYGADAGLEGGSESLVVSDPEEAFLFQILPDDTGTSAIWVAQRVPDDHVGVVANMFTVRDVDLTDTTNFLGSSNMHSIAQKHGWWDPSMGLLDFTATFSDGEYASQYYSGRRMWRFFGLSAPSIALNDTYTNLKYDRVYPATLVPDRKITPQDFMKWHRDYYQGTKYDMTQGLAAGPWGNPDRWGTYGVGVQGNWERSIGIYRTASAHVTQSRSWMPPTQGGVLWFAAAQPITSVFIPYSMGVSAVLPAHSRGDPDHLDRSSAYWAFRYVFNVAKFKFNYMYQEISAVQTSLENKGKELVAFLDQHYKTENITEAYITNAQHVVSDFWTLPDTLICKYADGYNTPPYPDWWLTAVGYAAGPPPPPPNRFGSYYTTPLGY
jgi:dipeptidase